MVNKPQQDHSHGTHPDQGNGHHANGVNGVSHGEAQQGAVETHDSAPGVKKGLTRRQMLYATLVAGALGIGVEELIRNGWINFGHDHDDHGNHENHEVDPQVLARLIENARMLQEIENTSVQAAFNAQHGRQAILVPKSPNRKKKHCVDERYKKGHAEGLAGVGVLMSDEELAAQAAEEVDEMEAAFRAGQEDYTLEICPHGAGKCGAAKLARTQAGEEDMSDEAIDGTALAGGNRFKNAVEAEIARRPALAGRRINVTVGMLDEQDFLQAHNHPAAIALHHAHPDMDYNSERETGALMYNVKNVKDGVLCAKIALGDHGMDHGPAEVPRPQNGIFRIVLSGPAEEVRALGAAYQRELMKPENAAIRNRVRVVTWVIREPNAALRQDMKKVA